MSKTTEEIQYREVSDLDTALSEALLKWGLALADTKHKLGLRISEWVNGAPALEAAVGASAMTQDELGHSRSLFAMLRSFPGAPEGIGAENDLQDRDLYYNPHYLDTPWSRWLDVIAVNVLLDRALSITIEATRKSSFMPLRQRAGKILQEEHFHRIYGDSWVGRLVTHSDEKRAGFQEAVNSIWPVALAWFGPSDETEMNLLCETGILTANASQLRSTWMDQVTSLLDKHGLATPSSEIDWSNWNANHRDISG